MRSRTIKLLCVPGLSQISCAWDTRLVSNDALEHLDVSRKQGRREKSQINFAPCMKSALSMWKMCMEGQDLVWIMQGGTLASDLGDLDEDPMVLKGGANFSSPSSAHTIDL